MKNLRFIFVAFCALSQAQAQSLPTPTELPNQWKLTPAGKQYELGDLPLNVEVSGSKRYLAITNNGQSDQSIQLFDVVQQKMTCTLPVRSAWFGLAFDGDQSLYASAGNGNYILNLSITDGKLEVKDTLFLGKQWPNRISPAGIALNPDKKRLYVVTKEDSALYILDITTKHILSKHPLPAEAYQCKLSHDGEKLYISCWGAAQLLVFNTNKNMIQKAITVGSNPNDFCLDRKERFAYVANANDNSISVVDLKKEMVIETLNTALYPNAPSGSTPNAVCLSDDEHTLYIANADNNCLCLFDITTPGHSTGKGFIPTGWYPTSVKLIGSTIYVANGKGLGSMANPYGPNPMKRREKVTYQQGQQQPEQKVQYIGGLFKGTLSAIAVPDPKTQEAYTSATFANSPYSKEIEALAAGEPNNPIPRKVGEASPIKHVFYIIKENRTYDQVLGDVPEGAGDTSLVLFGSNVTPNQHALAKEFVLLDHFYVNGEVSADGHNWSTGAYATDYLEKTWPTSYGGRGGNYDAEGNRAIANNKAGFIWDACARKNVSFRTYGEFADNYKANYKTIENHFCTYYTSWNESISDTTRFYQWKRDFDSLLSVGKVPQLNTLRFINDHTEGLRIGRPTPIAHVADNDRAVGLFVEYLSKSIIWNESVVFILEDDAQNGPDHIDAHRSIAFVAGGYVKRHFVDHTPYSTASMLRTMELILGVDPMSQFDAAATPMFRCFTQHANQTPFVSELPRVDLTKRNVAFNKWQKMNEEFDFTQEDKVPDELFNQVIWAAVKGEKVPYPRPHRAAYLRYENERDED